MNNDNNDFNIDVGGGTENPSENNDAKDAKELSLPENAADINADGERALEAVAENNADIESGERAFTEDNVDSENRSLSDENDLIGGNGAEPCRKNGESREAFERLNGKTAENEGTACAESSPVNGRTAESKRNMAEILNSYLFDGSAVRVSEPKRGDTEFLKALWKKAGLLVLTALVAFFGAFACIYYVCNTALLGDSDFFATLMLKNSGVTVNRVELDMVSADYTEDTTELARKISECSAALRVYRGTESVGSGSAVILSEDGIAVTNYHVAYGHEDALKAELCDGTRCDVEVLHLDKISDIAVIKIKSSKKLTKATLGDSETAKAGQSVAICGNPLGLEFSVSFGKISHPDRDLGEAAGNYLQLDATVNPGNSGGGVFDAAGNFIGIVYAKATGTDVDGIGYAIPSVRVIKVVNDLLKNGYVSGRPAIGLTLAQVTSETWDYFKNGENGIGKGELYDYLYESRYGIYVTESNYTDEFKKGDRIVSGGGRTFSDTNSFSEWLLNFKPGDTVKITVERVTGVDENPLGGLTVTRETKEIECKLFERNWADKPYEK